MTRKAIPSTKYQTINQWAAPTILRYDFQIAHIASNNIPLQDEEAESSSESESELATYISFGTLAKAQANLQRSPKHTAKSSVREEAVDNAGNDDAWQDNEAIERKAGRKDQRDFSRTSKHAPAEISSKKAVSRKREVLPVIKREYRDPRFEPLSGPLDERKLKIAYSFLDDYREDEMKELRIAIKKAKDEAEKKKLKRALLSMESRKKVQERKRKEAEILDTHRKEEKELVKQGKKPFYLKKAEQRQRLLVDRFSELKGKQLDRVLERRRKKVEGKEKKKLPWSRREIRERTR
jgi:ribosomal RNA-processing protein 36